MNHRSGGRILFNRWHARLGYCTFRQHYTCPKACHLCTYIEVRFYFCIVVCVCSMMGFITYLRLKVVVVLLRLLARLVSGPTQYFPDRVLHISSRQGDRKIKVHVYNSRSDDSKPRPVLLNLHGSGFILPFHGSDDEFCARVVRETEYTVLDVQYRLVPENPFPAVLEDVEDVANWILQRPEDFDLTDLPSPDSVQVGTSPSLQLVASVTKALLARYSPSTPLSISLSILVTEGRQTHQSRQVQLLYRGCLTNTTSSQGWTRRTH
jgi:hypothetical protein